MKYLPIIIIALLTPLTVIAQNKPSGSVDIEGTLEKQVKVQPEFKIGDLMGSPAKFRV